MSDVNRGQAGRVPGRSPPRARAGTPRCVDQQVASFAELVEQGHTATELDVTAPPVLEVENLTMYFPVKSSGVIRRTIGHVQAVDGISFQVPKGGSLGLVGESGCGKSTTGRLITRLYTPTAGSMRVRRPRPGRSSRTGR